MQEQYVEDRPRSQQGREWSRIVARAWADEAFRTRLLLDPRTVLREHGVELGSNVQALVHENTDDVCHFVLPQSPAGELSEEELSPVAGADSYSGSCHRCHRCGRCGCGCDRA
jgi:hypothetical protein